MNSKQLFDLLLERGVDPLSQPVTLMRHKDSRYPLFRYIGTEALTLYQAMQQRRHEPGGLMVGFYGHKADYGLLLGVWRIMHVMAAAEAHERQLLAGSFEDFQEGWDGYFHELQLTDILSDVRLKLEIQWGGRPNSWRRVLKRSDNYPVRIREEPPVPFQGAHNASLVMAELRMVLEDLDWQQGLGGCAGVYVITDERTGRHYVGSASGGVGVWQRWAEYARSGHGGNRELIELIRDLPGRENEFRFTLIESMPILTPRAQILARELFWKVALGSRKFGLNAN